jgi:uncharacterized membrane protein YkvA (DUF1232 family)
MIRALLDQLLLTWRLFRDPRVPLWTKAIPILAIAYVLSPLDLIPDFIIGLGQLDDLGLIFGAMRLFESVTPDYVVAEHRKELERRHKPLEIVNNARYRIFRQGDEKEKAKRG